jgi:hypothetical protein
VSDATTTAVVALPAVLPAEGEIIQSRPRGRPKGATNKNRVATIERIMRESDPIGFLMKIQRGGKIKAAPESGAQTREWIYPTIDQRQDAAQTLARKILPDLRATEHSGPLGAPLQVHIGIRKAEP